ncbi:hypothetical protein OEA41_009673 [Lepraria neglecta]|uniref:Uncharacterized protein n=1 Tax=Lepraria neglecta TaxID=209136 RepID=A0AAD9Z3K0_9LECA|nr:hypothetical protein OEA41_009673 [Lepraria neglecta]
MSGFTIDASGLIAIADLTTIAKRIHQHQYATKLNGGELPDTAASINVHKFCVENQATVFYLQELAVTGHLVTMSVEEFLKRKMSMKLWRKQIGLSILLCAALTLVTLRKMMDEVQCRLLARPAPHPWLYPLASPPARVVAFSNYTAIQLNVDNLEDIINEFYWEAQGVNPSTKLGVERKAWKMDTVGMVFYPTEETTYEDWLDTLGAVQVFMEKWDLVGLEFVVEEVGGRGGWGGEA